MLLDLGKEATATKLTLYCSPTGIIGQQIGDTWCTVHVQDVVG